MAPTLPTNTSFLYSSFNTQPKPTSITTIDKKTSDVGIKTLSGKSNSIWYTDIPTENESHSDSPTPSPHNRTQSIPLALSPPPKRRAPVPLPRSSTTILSTIQDQPKIGSPQTINPLGAVLLDDVLTAKNGLKKTKFNNLDPLPKKTPPLPPPQKSKPKKVVFTNTSSPDIIHNSLDYNPENSEAIPDKSILKKTNQLPSNITCEDASSLSKIENDLRSEIEELNKVLQDLGIDSV